MADDRFHAGSVCLTNFHVSPTCALTRSALLTGRHEFKNGVTHTINERERLTLKATTLAQVIKGAGYATGIFGKWHLGDEAAYQPGRRGFDETFIHGGGGIGQSYPGSCGDAPGNRYFDPAILHNGTFVKTRVSAFWRWPAAWQGGADVGALTAHIDVFPTLAEITGAELSDEVRAQVEGRSLLPLLRDAGAAWPERYLFTHLGRWPRGQAGEAKFAKCAVRDSRFALVNNSELYDLSADPGQTTNVIATHAGTVAAMRAAYDKWWDEVVPMLVNEDAVGPAENPFKELYQKQFGGEPPSAKTSPEPANSAP